ncbi:hypothetical protein AQUCO_00400456v1 [Aquilegia coerulea]|uniref:Tower domain-containing protein n=1 Tax=Aquilegia coerulea TaxID=218851 RepID=A0A2G5EUZ0_AQUCA|nr:hypothetical protein AQUCO_00400456v1 [Aquilegia coerulea]
MPTWQIFSDAGNTYRWVSYGQASMNSVEAQSHKTLINCENPTSRLPSIEDLLIQGSSKLLPNCGAMYDEKAPLFRTGSGKSVEVKQSSITKAMSVLNEGDVSDTGSLRVLQNCCNVHVEKSSMFRTGSGKPVEVKQASVLKALSVLGEDDVTDRGCSKILQDFGGVHDEKSAMFRTGSGKSVEVKQSSIMKALTVLGTDDVTSRGQMCATTSGRGFSNSLFQTASGKTVNLSPASLVRAEALLGLEESSVQKIADKSNGWENSSNQKKGGRRHINATVASRPISEYPVSGQTDVYAMGCESRELLPDFLASEMLKSTGKPPPIKFQTAGGKSISISDNAMQRAKSLLGDSEFGNSSNKGGADGQFHSPLKENRLSGTSFNQENAIFASRLEHIPAKRKSNSKSFFPPKAPIFKENKGSTAIEAFVSAQTIGPRTNPLGRSSCGPLVDISNSIGTAYADQNKIPHEKRRFGKLSSVSPFKKPRNSRFSTPLTSNISLLPYGTTTLTSREPCSKEKIFARYPFQVARATVKDFFGGPPHQTYQSKHISPEVKCMNGETAEIYTFHEASHLDGIGADAFRHMLAQSGVSMQYATREWVANHYKWIVWKLACYERGYPAKTIGKYLTVSNVLEELKYRYEREVNHAHRSALKRILEGDASPASMVVLCISAIRSNLDDRLDLEPAVAIYEDTNKLSGAKMADNSKVAKIELTDGWYAIDAILDVPLSKQLVAKKLFIGQKLRIWRAGLCGWVAPTSPLESSRTVSLQLNMNGTYRAHWADKLGLCRGPATPLAFSCIKSDGGVVPKTLVGITRIYPILYKESLADGGSLVRSERMERKIQQVYNQKRSTIAEGLVSEFQKDVSSFSSKNENDSHEGAELLKILEKSAEPELVMAELSTNQLTSFANYQAKQAEIRQSDMEKKIEKALKEAGLSERHVKPFMRVRVVGLTSNHSPRKNCHREGLITIWNPTEKQQLELVEGHAYTVAGLIPLNSDSETIYLHARGSTTTWQTLPSSAIASFDPFFTPRKPVFLSNMGELPLASEFDIAALVVYVGDVYLSGHHKKQWVFVTDGSIAVSELESKDVSNCLLAISICTPTADNDSFAPISSTLAGSTIGFINLVKRAHDPMNHLWVAEATDNSTYSFRYDIPGYYHLKEVAGSACKWAKMSSLAIQKLKEKILFIVGNGKS